MADTNSQVVEVLNDLLKNAHDGAQSYRVGAEETESVDLKQRFTSLVTYHEKTAQELATLIATYGGEPTESGSIGGAAHRGWLKVKTAVGADSDHSILEEAERGEDANVARYRKASKEALPADVAAVVSRLAANAQQSHDIIKALRDQAKAQKR